MYYIYILRCIDDSLYTGITNDINKRYQQHLLQLPSSAKYTKSHQVVSLDACWSCENKPQALKLEYRIKQLKKEEKENLIMNQELFNQYFNSLLEVDDYHRKDISDIKS